MMGNVSADGTRKEKKVILKVNPLLKFMAEDGMNFASSILMLFGEFTKQATTTVEVKANVFSVT